MFVAKVAPRDTTWEDTTPIYRVHFWARRPAPAGFTAEATAWESEECEIRDAKDVDEVIAWASGPGHGGREFTLYVRHECQGQPGLIQLSRRRLR